MQCFSTENQSNQIKHYDGTKKRAHDSGLDKDLDEWVFYPLLFNLMSILLRI